MKKMLFLGSKDNEYVERALEFCKDKFIVTSNLGEWCDCPEDMGLGWWEGEYIVSVLSRWVLPERLLKRATHTAINFHPAPPEYPSIGCLNYALYDGAKFYGVTCHEMVPEVDTGTIIDVNRFKVYPDDTVESLTKRTYEYMLAQFYTIVGILHSGFTLPPSKDEWSGKKLPRRNLDELSEITFDMSEAEVARRIRATNYKEWKPYIKHKRYTFEYKDKFEEVV